MSGDYYPDRWIAIEITTPEQGTIRKILASWYGGFAGSDSWKLNSGIVKVVDCGDEWQVLGETGSVYHCVKGKQGMSYYTSTIFNGWQQQSVENNWTIKEIELNDYT